MQDSRFHRHPEAEPDWLPGEAEVAAASQQMLRVGDLGGGVASSQAPGGGRVLRVPGPASVCAGHQQRHGAARGQPQPRLSVHTSYNSRSIISNKSIILLLSNIKMPEGGQNFVEEHFGQVIVYRGWINTEPPTSFSVVRIK